MPEELARLRGAGAALAQASAKWRVGARSAGQSAVPPRPDGSSHSDGMPVRRAGSSASARQFAASQPEPVHAGVDVQDRRQRPAAAAARPGGRSRPASRAPAAMSRGGGIRPRRPGGSPLSAATSASGTSPRIASASSSVGGRRNAGSLRDSRRGSHRARRPARNRRPSPRRPRRRPGWLARSVVQLARRHRDRSPGSRPPSSVGGMSVVTQVEIGEAGELAPRRTGRSCRSVRGAAWR